ncbi:hypothetical protein MSPP1_000192 [Malassezia sp. CBS 17886]|nr:hypothetical protein MSPP1_000192 [Malassezia sp. CBS 17886]
MHVDVDRCDDAERDENISFYTHVPNHFDGALVDPPEGRTETPYTLSFLLHQALSVLLSSAILISIVMLGLCVRLSGMPGRWMRRKDNTRAWDNPQRWKRERLTKSPQYYAQSCGFDIVDEQVETQDGYYLRMHRVVCPASDVKTYAAGGHGGFPILIMHGLFQSSGSFITSEDRSLAFWLAKRGYQVYLGNNRAAYEMGHRTFSRYSAEFWDYNIRDLALYDLPAMVDHVRRATGYKKIAYIGHSQGNATAFLALSRWFFPDLGRKISYFAALAPAVFAGPLTTRFPFTAMSSLGWVQWRRLFGVLDYTPLMKFSYDWTPARPYAALGYQMFAYLFEWNDTNWLQRPLVTLTA